MTVWLLLYAALICVPVGIASAMLPKRGGPDA